MFHHEADYPIAVASPDDVGLVAAIDWCIDHMEDGDHIAVWTALRSNLVNNQTLKRFVDNYSNVDHVVARGGAYLRETGPVLMAWADPDEIAEFTGSNGHSIRALCVVSWNQDKLRPWVSAAHPELLGDASAWMTLSPALDPVVEAAMQSVTRTINHNNTIAAGYEKDDVVSTLLALHDASYALDAAGMAGWAVANGWRGGNPAHLEEYIKRINNGSRPRTRRSIRPDYIDGLRAKVAEASAD